MLALKYLLRACLDLKPVNQPATADEHPLSGWLHRNDTIVHKRTHAVVAEVLPSSLPHVSGFMLASHTHGYEQVQRIAEAPDCSDKLLTVAAELMVRCRFPYFALQSNFVGRSLWRTLDSARCCRRVLARSSCSWR